MVHVEFTPQALEDLAQLDSGIANRIAAKIQWFSEHYDHIQPETLPDALRAYISSASVIGVCFTP